MATRMTSARFVGRAGELAELRPLCATQPRAGASLALVGGESGVGKSRLAGELSRHARESGARVLSGDCVELGEDELPYAPLPHRAPASRSRRRPRARRARALPPRSARRDPPGPRRRSAPAPRPLNRASSRRSSRCSTGSPSRTPSSCHRGPPLGGQLDAPLPPLPRAHDLQRAPARARDLPLRRAPSAPPAPAAGRRARERSLLATARAAALHPRGAGRAARGHPGRRRGPGARRAGVSRSEGNALYAEEILAAGLDGRGALPPTLRDALMLRVERLSPQRPGADPLARVPAGRRPRARGGGGRARPGRAARRASRGRGEPHRRDGRRRELRLPPRAAPRGRLRRPPPRRAHRDARRLARALEDRIEAGEGGAHITAQAAYHWASAGDQPQALAAAVRAALAAERVNAFGEAQALFERALALWERVPDPEKPPGSIRSTLEAGRVGTRTRRATLCARRPSFGARSSWSTRRPTRTRTRSCSSA